MLGQLRGRVLHAPVLQVRGADPDIRPLVHHRRIRALDRCASLVQRLDYFRSYACDDSLGQDVHNEEVSRIFSFVSIFFSFFPNFSQTILNPKPDTFAPVGGYVRHGRHR